MGRNNNFAGMHLIRRRKYAEYEDLEFYDKYIEKKEKERKTKVERAKIMNEENTSSSNDETFKNQENILIKPIKEMENTLDNKPMTKKQKHIKEDPYYMPEKNDWNSFYRKYTWLKPIKSGTESIVPLNCFDVPDNMRANIMIISMKNKIDIAEVLNSCEEAMKNDKNCNPPLTSFDYGMPKLENSIVFLALLAEKLECSIQEFFIDDKERNKKFVYRLINEIKQNKSDYWFDIVDIADDYAEFSISQFDLYYRMAKYSKPFVYMDLTFEKNVFDNGTIDYSLYFGMNRIGPMTVNNYMIKGAYLWEEEEGELKSFIEELIQNPPDSL